MFTRITHNVHVVIVRCVSYIALGQSNTLCYSLHIGKNSMVFWFLGHKSIVYHRDFKIVIHFTKFNKTYICNLHLFWSKKFIQKQNDQSGLQYKCYHMKAKNCQNSFITLKNKLYVHCTDILVYMQDVVLKKCWTNYTYIQVYTGESR